jgi:pimeloyl-ACP methyl ester carboxylesterase
MTNGEHPHVVARGTGPGVVCSHGFADDAATFEPLLGGLGDAHRIVTWHLPGHGGAPIGPTAGTRPGALAGLEEAMAAAGPGPVTLIGHSLGGYLSLCQAVLAPAGVAGLVLMSTGPGFRDPAKRARWNERIRDYAAERGVPSAVAGMGEQPDSVALDGLASVTVPSLIIVGGEDRSYLRGCRLMADTMADATLLVVAGAGHFPHRTHTAEVTASIRNLLERVRSSTASEAKGDT